MDTLTSLDRRLPSISDVLSERRNAFTFLRWFLAAMVVVDHSYPIGGFNHGLDPMWTWSKGQDSLGGIAVAGFFVISGFLVCHSQLTSRSTTRFLWKRFLRIFPGYWVCLLVTAFAFAPIAWIHERATLSGFFSLSSGGPFRYVLNNAGLQVHQWNIDGLLTKTPYTRTNFALAWDGSLWTLIYEFKCYLALAGLGFLGLLLRRRFIIALTFAMYLLTLSHEVQPTWAPHLLPVLRDPFVARFLFLFLLGVIFELYKSEIPMSDRLGSAALIVALITLHTGGWVLLGYPAMGYALLWLAARLPMASFDRVGDFSYGTYIYAFPIQVLLAEFGFERHGSAAFIGVSIGFSTMVAALSWYLIEKRALRLKSLHIPVIKRTSDLLHRWKAVEGLLTKASQPDVAIETAESSECSDDPMALTSGRTEDALRAAVTHLRDCESVRDRPPALDMDMP